MTLPPFDGTNTDLRLDVEIRGVLYNDCRIHGAGGLLGTRDGLRRLETRMRRGGAIRVWTLWTADETHCIDVDAKSLRIVAALNAARDGEERCRVADDAAMLRSHFGADGWLSSMIHPEQSAECRRLAEQGLIELASWDAEDPKRKAWRLTDAGRAALAASKEGAK